MTDTQYTNITFIDEYYSDVEDENDDSVKITLTQGHIYKISSPLTNKVYIGSSTNPNNRFCTHKYDYKRYLDTGFKNCKSIEVFILSNGLVNFDILQTFWFEKKEELYKKEAYYISLYGDDVVNTNKPHLSEKDRLENYKKQLEKNRNRPKIKCDRCFTYTKNLKQHQATRGCFYKSLF